LALPAQHDRVDTVDRCVDQLAGRQVAGHVFDALPGLVADAAEHPHVVAGLEQARHDEAPKRARSSGEQDG
jgi:hypothetical protein